MRDEALKLRRGCLAVLQLQIREPAHVLGPELRYRRSIEGRDRRGEIHGALGLVLFVGNGGARQRDGDTHGEGRLAVAALEIANRGPSFSLGTAPGKRPAGTLHSEVVAAEEEAAVHFVPRDVALANHRLNSPLPHRKLPGHFAEPVLDGQLYAAAKLLVSAPHFPRE